MKRGEIKKMTAKKTRVKKEMRKFVLQENGKDTEHIYTGRTARVAALKAASAGHTNIKLRERTANKLHSFAGKITMVPKPEKAPAWLKTDEKGRIRKPNVRKNAPVRHLN